MRANPYVQAVYKRSALPSQARAVLAALASHCDGDGYAWPSVGMLADYVGMSERTVRRSIVMASAAGELTRTVRRGRGITNLYHVKLPPVDKSTKNRTETALKPDTGGHKTGQSGSKNRSAVAGRRYRECTEKGPDLFSVPVDDALPDRIRDIRAGLTRKRPA